MFSFQNLRIGLKLYGSFFVVLVLMALIAAVGIVCLTSVNDKARYSFKKIYPINAESQKMAYNVMDSARLIRNLILNKDPAAIEKNKASLAKDREAIDESIAVIEKLIDTDAGKQKLQQVRDAGADFFAYSAEVAALALNNQNEEARQTLFGPKYQKQATYLAALKAMVDEQEKRMMEGMEQSQESYKNGLETMIGIGVAAIIIGMVLAWAIARSLLNQLGGEPQDAVMIARKIAAGDLTVNVSTKTGDKTSLLFAIRTMRESLNEIVTNVRGGTLNIEVASSEIASGNQDLSSRTEQQASSLEETASAMEELTSTVKQNANNAHQANQLALSASDVAQKGGEVVNQVIDMMDEINGSSRKIVDIISVIDGIAFQTNILALNAAVEAARAGEQGRGFAVVATEVRNLAQRSAAAAKEIKVLISDSVQKVENGSELVSNAGKTIGEIVVSVKKLNDVVSEIAVASQEQSEGISQVNLAITHMDATTQQNSALVEQAAAAAKSLQGEAATLAKIVSTFKVSTSGSTEIVTLT